MPKNNQSVLKVRGLKVQVEGKEIVKGIDLDIAPGEVHAVMGPNGSGKSTLTAALMGHPAYEVKGEITIDGESLLEESADVRARKGLFLGFQYPVAVPGVSVASFLRTAVNIGRDEPLSARVFRNKLKSEFEKLDIPWEFAARYLNDGFSGGEKKRLEILQMSMLEPKVALLDEIDSGLDIDALKIVADGINRAAKNNVGVLLVTHYQRILDYVTPDRVHVFMDGRIVRSGGPEQALELEEKGYEWLGDASLAAGGI